MLSSRKTLFQDITNKKNQGNSTRTQNLLPSLSSEILKCDVYADPKEVKMQRDRERYATNKDNISKRRRQLQELKKLSTATVNNENILCATQAIGQSGVTQIQVRAT
jgi:hypothetical protein